MSRRGVAIPPPPDFNNGQPQLDWGGFAVPLPPPLPKSVAKEKVKPSGDPVRKRKSRFSDAPPCTDAPPPKILPEIAIPLQKKLDTGEAIGSSESDKATLVSAAAAAAARINANLLAQGKMKSHPAGTGSQLTSPSTVSSAVTDPPNPASSAEIKRVDDFYISEVEINDVPVGCRNYLTRSSTQESINKSCMAYVSTRGRYTTPEERKQHPLLLGMEKPLYLHIKSSSELNVKKALERIKQIISNHYEKKSRYQSEALAQIASLTQKAPAGSNSTGIPSSVAQAFTPGFPLIPTTTTIPLPLFQPALPSGNFMQEKLFIGLDNIPEHVDLKTKLIGPTYRNFNFISNQTGAKVILRGRGSGFNEPTSGREAFEPMYAFISHPNQSGVDAAKKLVLNLIETVKAELGAYSQSTISGTYNPVQNFGDYRPALPPMPVPPIGGEGKPKPLTAYPFQQISMPPIPVSNPSKQSYESSYLGYQQNFPGTESNSESDSSSKEKRRDKQRKRFTEDLMMPPAQPPPTVPSDSDPGRRNTALGPDLKKVSLPFWMTP